MRVWILQLRDRPAKNRPTRGNVLSSRSHNSEVSKRGKCRETLRNEYYMMNGELMRPHTVSRIWLSSTDTYKLFQYHNVCIINISVYIPLSRSYDEFNVYHQTLGIDSRVVRHWCQTLLLEAILLSYILSSWTIFNLTIIVSTFKRVRNGSRLMNRETDGQTIRHTHARLDISLSQSDRRPDKPRRMEC